MTNEELLDSIDFSKLDHCDLLVAYVNIRHHLEHGGAPEDERITKILQDLKELER